MTALLEAKGTKDPLTFKERQLISLAGGRRYKRKPTLERFFCWPQLPKNSKKCCQMNPLYKRIVSLLPVCDKSKIVLRNFDFFPTVVLGEKLPLADTMPWCEC